MFNKVYTLSTLSTTQYLVWLPHNKKVPGSSPGRGKKPFHVEFVCTPHVHVGFRWVLWFPSLVQKHVCYE